MTVAELFPEIRPWVENLVNVWPAYIIKPQFASWQVLHILSLVILGGSSILLNLRLIGVGITEEPPSEVARNMRPWLHVGVVGITLSGILIGIERHLPANLAAHGVFPPSASCFLLPPFSIAYRPPSGPIPLPLYQ